MKKSALYTINIILIIFVVLPLFVSSINAQTASKGFTIIPPRFELFGNPGEVLTEQVRVRNDSSLSNTYDVQVVDFATAGEEGHVVLEEEGHNTTFTLAQWIKTSASNLTLQPNQEKTFSFTITIPKNAEPGGHYASILFSSATQEQTPGSASVTERIGTLILLRISGNVTETAQIETFESPKYAKSGPITFVLRLKNDGNVHVQPKGTIIITNLFGQKVEEIPLNGANVLPMATRKMETVWDKKNILGAFTATLVATYGQQNLPLTSAVRFTVVSPTAAALLIGGSIALIIFLLTLISGRKRVARALKVLASGK